jgi:hypothetical protein
MPLQQTSGNATSDAYGSSAAAGTNFIEDMFSTYLYTGTGATRTIINGIDLSTKGGLVWLKSTSAGFNHNLFDTAQGATKLLHSNTSNFTRTDADSLTAFGTTGFTLGSGDTGGSEVNSSGIGFVSWTFRKQPKFFDVVTYTGTGAIRTVAHNLGSVPGCIIVKSTTYGTGGYDWSVYHSGLPSAAYALSLNSTAQQSSQPTVWNSTAPTSAVFTVGTDNSTNRAGETYVAYLFASNAGGFGLTGANNVITCGTFNDFIGTPVNLGFEPQFVLLKVQDTTGPWDIYDTMRGFTVNTSNNVQALYADNSGAQTTATGDIRLTSTGFVPQGNFGASYNFIYIAIRRGPMKVPTNATKVFNPRYALDSTNTYTLNFNPDMHIGVYQVVDYTGTPVNSLGNYFQNRLVGNNLVLTSTSTAAEASPINYNQLETFAGSSLSYKVINSLVSSYGLAYDFARAPGFFDVVCYTGTGSATTFNHNLGAVPELMIIKRRSGATAWQVYSSAIANTEYLVLNTSAAKATGTTRWNSTTPTSSVFSVGTASEVNASSATYVNYLFATCPGVSKVGSYSGTGATQTINCGFTGGARFVLIKRTDSTGDWYFWDTSRGMVSGTDPSLLLNSSAAEVNANSVYTTGVGFQIVSTAADINASGGTYIFLAVA